MSTLACIALCLFAPPSLFRDMANIDSLNPHARIKVLNELAESDNAAFFLPTLITRLEKEPIPEVRVAIFECFVKIAPKAGPAVPAIIASIGNAEEPWVYQGYHALYEIGPAAKKAIPWLTARLNSEASVTIRRRIPGILLTIDAKCAESAKSLEKGTADKDEIVQLECFLALAKYSVEWRDKAKRVWLRFLESEQDGIIVGRAVNHMVELRDTSPPLLELTRRRVTTDDEYLAPVCLNAVVALDGKSDTTHKLLVASLTHPFRRIRFEASETLGKVATDPAFALKGLSDALAVEKEELVLISIAGSIVFQESHRERTNVSKMALKAIISHLDHENHNVRSMAARKLGEMGAFAIEAAPLLEKLLADEWDDVSTAAKQALEQIKKASGKR